jgi:hypothetical protein
MNETLVVVVVTTLVNMLFAKFIISLIFKEDHDE